MREGKRDHKKLDRWFYSLFARRSTVVVTSLLWDGGGFGSRVKIFLWNVNLRGFFRKNLVVSQILNPNKNLAKYIRPLKLIVGPYEPPQSSATALTDLLRSCWTLRSFPEALRVDDNKWVTNCLQQPDSSQAVSAPRWEPEDDGNPISVWKVSDTLRWILLGGDNKSGETRCTFPVSLPSNPASSLAFHISTQQTSWQWTDFFQ